jgi:hypothetical protein
MGSDHCLPHEFTAFDYRDDSKAYSVELFEDAGRLFMRIGLSGEPPNARLTLEFSRDNAHTFADGAQQLATRLI